MRRAAWRARSSSTLNRPGPLDMRISVAQMIVPTSAQPLSAMNRPFLPWTNQIAPAITKVISAPGTTMRTPRATESENTSSTTIVNDAAPMASGMPNFANTAAVSNRPASIFFHECMTMM